jgi:mannose-1-phosphate guanylyltransferase
MQAVILVGGEGTRLRPITYTIPKPLIPLMNRPFLTFQFELCRQHGITDIILSTSYLSSIFEEAFGEGESLGVKLTYVTEESPLDTCGAVKNVEEHIDGPFMVFNGDVLTDLDLTRMIGHHRDKGSVTTISLTPVEDPSAYGLVPLDGEGRVLEFLEKPGPEDEIVTNLINAGTYVIEPGLLSRVPACERHSFERQFFPGLLSEGQPVYGFPSDAYWLDIGTPAKYLQAHLDILDHLIPFEFSGTEVAPSVWVEEGTVIEPGSLISGPVVIGRDCHIKAGAIIRGHSVLGDGCCIAPEAVIERSVLLEGVRVGEESVVNGSILGRRVRLGRDVEVRDLSVLGEGVKVGDSNQLKLGIRVWPEREISADSIHF